MANTFSELLLFSKAIGAVGQTFSIVQESVLTAVGAGRFAPLARPAFAQGVFIKVSPSGFCTVRASIYRPLPNSPDESEKILKSAFS